MKIIHAILFTGLVVTALAGCGRSATHQASDEYVISITDKGFEPAETKIPKGQPVTLVFTRKTDQTCATEVVFPTLKQRHPLPLNQQVRVSLPASAEGTISYVCGMNMLGGSVVVR